MKKHLPIVEVLFYFLITISIALVSFINYSTEEDGEYELKGKAGSFEYITMDGQVLKSSDLEGKVILLEFWDTHCGPCMRIMPEIKALQDKYMDNDKVVILIVNAGWESMENAQAYGKRKNNSDILSYMTKKQSRRLGVKTLPTSILIDKNFHYTYKHVGYNEETDLDMVKKFDEKITALLN